MMNHPSRNPVRAMTSSTRFRFVGSTNLRVVMRDFPGFTSALNGGSEGVGAALCWRSVPSSREQVSDQIALAMDRI